MLPRTDEIAPHVLTMRGLFVLVMLVLLPACTHTNIIHQPTQVAEPVGVAVLDHGRHASLVVEVPPNGMIRYSYGDWRWYALKDTGIGQAMNALARPSQAALARRAIPAPFSPQTIRDTIAVGIEEIIIVQVERSAAEALRRKLDRLFFANIETMVTNTDYGLDMVHHPEPYSFGHNSNHMVVRWLEELGCRVEGSGTYSDWQLSSR